MTDFTLNGNVVSLDQEADKPLLWVLREDLGLTGTKFGCGKGLCGACTVLVEGAPTRACLTPLGAVAGRRVETIESAPDAAAQAVRKAWIAVDVPQCGYCQSGQIMTAAALLRDNPAPDRAAVDAAMRGILCRCGTYPRIRSAIDEASAALVAGRKPEQQP